MLNWLRKQPSTGILKKRYSKNMPQIYTRTSMPLLCNFIEIALRHGYSLVNLFHIFRTPFPKNTCGGLLLTFKVDLMVWNMSILVISWYYFLLYYLRIKFSRCHVKNCKPTWELFILSHTILAAFLSNFWISPHFNFDV